MAVLPMPDDPTFEPQPRTIGVTLGIWQMVGGVWSKVTQKIVYVTTPGAGASSYTLNWSVNEPFQFSSGVTAWGVTVDAVGNGGSNPQITSFNSVSWQAQASGGTRSATPNNQQTTITVNPT